MREFIYRENIKHFGRLLDRTSDENERARIMNLLAEELAKATTKPSEGDPTPMRHSA